MVGRVITPRGGVAAGVAALLVLVTSGLAGCSPGSGDRSSGPLATYEATGEGGFGALLSGTLTAVDGCVLVEQEDGTLVLPVFADSVEWVAEDQLVRLGRADLEVGETVELGGGFAEGRGVARPAACPDDAETFLVSQDS